MSELVAPTEIERIVGAPRHPDRHLGRAVTAEQAVYILHSQACKDSGGDLRDCEYSVALDRGIDDLRRWDDHQDETVVLVVLGGRLMPVRIGVHLRGGTA